MRVEVVKLDNFGRGIAYVNDKICFIENALPNEIVEIEIINETKKYFEAKVINLIEKSPFRIEVECPYSLICGGCDLNHICYNEENKFKTSKVKSIVSKFGEIDSNLVNSIVYGERDNYRNKIVLHGKDRKLGLYKKDTHEIIPISSCLISNPKINEIIKLLNKFNKDIKEVTIKTSNDNSKIMLKINGEVDNINELKNYVDILIINDEYLTESKKIITNIGSKKFLQGIDSFFQVNNTLTTKLYDEVLNNVKNDKFKTVLDLYCGTGTIGIYISDYVDKVIGIDYNKSNIEDAFENKKINGTNNIEFICDKVENKIDEFKDIDLIIIDPPRAGLDEKTRNYLKKINPKKIIYVSCDVVTLSRDLKDLKDNYKINYIKPFNMFPRTYHVECVSVLTRRN